MGGSYLIFKSFLKLYLFKIKRVKYKFLPHCIPMWSGELGYKIWLKLYLL